MKKIILPIIFVIAWFALLAALGKDTIPDQSTSNYNERQCQDFGEGKGCW